LHFKTISFDGLWIGTWFKKTKIKNLLLNQTNFNATL
jgi:hypothetical protein